MKMVFVLMSAILLSGCVNQVMTEAGGPVYDTLDASPSTKVDSTIALDPKAI